MFEDVAFEIRRETGNKQQPWMNSWIGDERARHIQLADLNPVPPPPRPNLVPPPPRPNLVPPPPRPNPVPPPPRPQPQMALESDDSLLPSVASFGLPSFGPMNRDIKVLRKWRTQEPVLQRKWKGSKGRFGLFEDPKSWKGAKFTDGLGLTFLDVEGNSVLYGNTLTSLPAEIGQLATLRFLHLNYNQLTTLPTQIGQLTSLETLYLRGNNLTSVPTQIGQLTSLRWLDLSDNQLTTLPTQIGQLTSLETLHLSGNNKTMSLPGSISKLYSLRMLSLGGYQFKHFPEVIKALRTYGCEFDINEAGCCGNCVIS